MKRFAIGVIVVVALGIAMSALILAYFRISSAAPVTADAFFPAPATVDPGPKSALPDLPPGAIAFDLKYRGRTGAENDIDYRSYWGFGGSDSANDPFIQEVRKRTSKLSYVNHGMLKNREWSAVEHAGRKIIALYFDLDADGKLADNERILPTRKAADQSIEFITPDFALKTEDGQEVKFRVLLQVRFYGGNQEPNFMWSPACVLEGTATVGAQPTRMVLFANGFRGVFDHFGSSGIGWLVGDSQPESQSYFPRETLSSLVRCAGQFYNLKFEGRTGIGHVARAVLTRDSSPTGRFEVKCAGTNVLKTKVSNLYVQGSDNRTICFSLEDTTSNIPVGNYLLQRGHLYYGSQDHPGWAVSFSDGPKVALQADRTVEVTLGEPVLTVRAIREQDRYVTDAKPVTAVQRGTRIYLEPKITGKGGELLTRFERRTEGGSKTTSLQPSIQITGPNGQVVLSQKLEYG